MFARLAGTGFPEILWMLALVNGGQWSSTWISEPALTDASIREILTSHIGAKVMLTSNCMSLHSSHVYL